MPTFPDGTRIWISRTDGTPLEEYKEQVETGEALKHTRSVYIAAQKGEFVVWYNIKQSDAPCRRLKVLVDGNPARHYHFRPVHCNVDHKCEGWLVNPTTTRRFAFGDIEVNNDDDLADGSEKSKQLLRSCIEVRLIDATLSQAGRRGPACAQPIIASAVHPDSKIAALVQVQVKTGGTVTCPPQVASNYQSSTQEGAVEYSARFMYRQESFLVAQSIKPRPEVGSSKRKRSNSVQPKQGEAAQVKKSRKGAQDKPVEVVDLDAPPKPKVYVDLETGEEFIKQEQTGGQSSEDAINVDDGPRNQKVFLDLSSEVD